MDYLPSKYKFSDGEIELLKEKINNVVGKPGCMFIADTNGIHSNQPKNKRRRVIVFEFQPEKSTSTKSTISVSSNLLSKRVLDNINVFTSNHDCSEFEHGIDQLLFHKRFNIPIGLLLNVFYENTWVRLMKKVF
ncbi:MAG: hypothetical protein ABGW56_02385 [Flavobacteriaceae bacterium]|jgi:hypothetical protein